VAATSERILSGRGLERPPPSFQPILPPTTSTSSAPAAPAAPPFQDLISRYNLKDKVGKPVEETEGKGKEEKGGWSSSKSERAALLQRRREEMILRARRKMEEKERGVEG